MQLKQAKEQFLETWGILGTHWGISRTMAQIHALLLITENPISTEEIMETLCISRGSANTHIRALIDWRLVERKIRLGERMEFFVAEKDIWIVATRIFSERKKREVEPLKTSLLALTKIDDEKASKASVKEFQKTVQDILLLTEAVSQISEKLNRVERKWFFQIWMKLIKN